MVPLFGAMRLPASVIFGRGQREAIGNIAATIGNRALVCTDSRMSADPMFDEIVSRLKQADVAVKIFDQTEADLPLSSIYDCVQRFSTFQPNMVIGIGGGSCMDMAKCVSLMLTHNGDIRQYYGENNVPGPVLPIIAAPTTSGTGSEVTPVAVVSDTERNTKVGISSPYLIPRVAICDPDLSLTCPPGLTAASGTDALTHAVEAFTAAPRVMTNDLTVKNVFVGKNILSDTFALLAIQNIWSSLKRAYDNGNDYVARERMMLAALAAGCAFGTAGTAAAHAIQYPIGNLTHTPHGVGVALLLPYVMEFNRPDCVDSYSEIARAIGMNGTGKSDEQLSHDIIDAIADLLESVGIPRSLKELGLDRDMQDRVAEIGFEAKRLVNNNPRKLDLDAMRAIARAAYSGDRSSLAQLRQPQTDKL